MFNLTLQIFHQYRIYNLLIIPKKATISYEIFESIVINIIINIINIIIIIII